MRAKQKQLEKEAEARYLERIAILSASRDADDPAFYDIPILPYVPEPGLTFNETMEHRIKYEFNCRLIRNENENRR